MSYTYKYPRPALTVDIIIFKKENDDIKVLLIQRDNPPFKGQWAFPGGFVNIDETLENAAKRELQEETALTDVELKQLYTFGAIDRDPRFRTVSVVYYGFTNLNNDKVKGGDDAQKAQWFLINKIPKLAFDHNEILKMALEKIK